VQTVIERILRWVIENLLQREYPLISIPIFPKTEVPYTTWCPHKISLCFTQRIKSWWGITDDSIDEITEAVIEHEYIHVVLLKVAGWKATHSLNRVNRYDLTTRRLCWMLEVPRKGEVFRDICRDGTRMNDDFHISAEYIN